MSEHQSHTSAKDFFLHLLSIVTLYISAISFGTLLFQIIDFNFPDALAGYYNDGSMYLGAVRWCIASIIVALPVFMGISKLITRDYIKNPEKKELKVRTWLMYLTMFIAAVAIIISTMSVIYNFLGGEITTRFMLKVLTIVYIAGMVFGYYLYKVRATKEDPRVLNGFMAVTIISTIAGLVMGFMFIGGPSTQRARGFDQQRMWDLSTITSGVEAHYYQTNALPAALKDVTVSYVTIPTDPETKKAYEYKVLSSTKYELCATFSMDKFVAKNYEPADDANNYIANRYYTQGRNCFEMTVTPATPDFKPLPIQ